MTTNFIIRLHISRHRSNFPFSFILSFRWQMTLLMVTSRGRVELIPQQKVCTWYTWARKEKEKTKDGGRAGSDGNISQWPYFLVAAFWNVPGLVRRSPAPFSPVLLGFVFRQRCGALTLPRSLLTALTDSSPLRGNAVIDVWRLALETLEFTINLMAQWKIVRFTPIPSQPLSPRPHPRGGIKLKEELEKVVWNCLRTVRVSVVGRHSKPLEITLPISLKSLSSLSPLTIFFFFLVSCGGYLVAGMKILCAKPSSRSEYSLHALPTAGNFTFLPSAFLVHSA